jgi:hypothetical protein
MVRARAGPYGYRMKRLNRGERRRTRLSGCPGRGEARQHRIKGRGDSPCNSQLVRQPSAQLALGGGAIFLLALLLRCRIAHFAGLRGEPDRVGLRKIMALPCEYDKREETARERKEESPGKIRPPPRETGGSGRRVHCSRTGGGELRLRPGSSDPARSYSKFHLDQIKSKTRENQARWPKSRRGVGNAAAAW